jgi:hypothetical protein
LLQLLLSLLPCGLQCHLVLLLLHLGLRAGSETLRSMLQGPQGGQNVSMSVPKADSNLPRTLPLPTTILP